MPYLWKKIDSLRLSAASKYKTCMLMAGLAFGLPGFLVWFFIIRPVLLPAWDWGACFTGYPVLISWLCIALYSRRHDFHDSCKP